MQPGDETCLDVRRPDTLHTLELVPNLLDDLSKELLSRWTGRKIIGIGTIGGSVKGPYEDRVRKNVTRAIEEDNICLGVGVCQGSVDLKRIERRRHLPKESKHYVSPEKYRRFLGTQGHPDQEDLDGILSFVRKTLRDLHTC